MRICACVGTAVRDAALCGYRCGWIQPCLSTAVFDTAWDRALGRHSYEYIVRDNAAVVLAASMQLVLAVMPLQSLQRCPLHQRDYNYRHLGTSQLPDVCLVS